MLALHCVIMVCRHLQTCAALIARFMKKLISLLVVYGSVLPTAGFAEHKESR